jgi:cobyrinic acid a,c-diamide synthase
MIASNVSRLTVSGLRGGSGKTVLTLGLIGAWRERGLSVLPFKKGPDYIDPAWHMLAAGEKCRNLDTFLMTKERIRWSFQHHSDPSAISLIEGNRGLFDGMDAEGTHSTAELAKLLQSPAVVIADCTKTTRTMAAIILGCRQFDTKLNLAGVVLNQVASARQEKVIRQALERATDVPVMGAIPRLKSFQFLERHLGLLPPAEHPDTSRALETAYNAVAKYVDVDGLLEIARAAGSLSGGLEELPTPNKVEGERPRIGVVRDSAFNFYYPDNLEELERMGASLIEVDSLHDRELPQIDALYIGGGFPETHAQQLAANKSFRASVRERAQAGLPIYAECGGLTFLGESIIVEGTEHPMVGVFPVRFAIDAKPQGHGYSVLQVDQPNPFFEVGCTIKGHEFRYSRALDCLDGDISTACRVIRGKGFDGKRAGLVYKNVMACFCHVHALGTEQWGRALVGAARDFRATQASA